jgi:hypothetical protein
MAHLFIAGGWHDPVQAGFSPESGGAEGKRRRMLYYVKKRYEKLVGGKVPP